MKEQEPVAWLNLYDLIILLVKWRKLFIFNFLVVVIIAVVVALTLPVWYSANTIILPPSGSSGGLPSFLPAELYGVATSFGLETPSDEVFQTILSSRTIKERIIERFNLREVYEMDENVFPEDLLAAFEGHYGIETRDDGSIVVIFEDRSPERAAEIANACVEELDRLYRDIMSETARNNRIYIGRRLQQVNDSLAFLQDTLIYFQKSTNAVAIPEQVAATIEAAAKLKAEQIATEVEMQVVLNSFNRNHPYVAQLEATSRELGDKYDRLVRGSEDEMLLGLKEIPELSRRYMDIIRQVRIQNNLLEFIYPQYERARIQEERESANVQVLDGARVPMRKSRPPRRVMVMVAAVASFIATLVLVLLIEYWRTLPERNKEDWSKVQEIFRFFKRGN